MAGVTDLEIAVAAVRVPVAHQDRTAAVVGGVEADDLAAAAVRNDLEGAKGGEPGGAGVVPDVDLGAVTTTVVVAVPVDDVRRRSGRMTEAQQGEGPDCGKTHFVPSFFGHGSRRCLDI